MANISATQKREHAVLNKMQTELAFFADRQKMTVAATSDASIPLAFNFDAFQLVDGEFDFTPSNNQSASMQSNDCAPTLSQEGNGADSLEWFSRLLQNAANSPTFMS